MTAAQRPLTDPSAPLPLHQQVSRLLLREIMAGRLVDGQKLAPERDMAAEMGIAIGTLRKALASLADQGLLERVQGSGNYIKADGEVAGIYSFFRLELPGGGGVPSAEVLSVARRPKPEDLPRFGRDQGAQRIRRLRSLNGQPVALEEIWLDAAWAESLVAEDLAQSLYHHYKTRLGLWITSAEDRVSLGTVPDWAPLSYGQRPGAACGFVLRQGRAQDGTIAEMSRTWYDPNGAVYVQRMT